MFRLEISRFVCRENIWIYFRIIYVYRPPQRHILNNPNSIERLIVLSKVRKRLPNATNN